MAIPNEALRKVLLEIEQKSIQSGQQISLVKTQIASKKRETRMLQLTSTEVSSLPAETRLYEGVGKMFIQTPTPDVISRIASEEGSLKSEIEALEKKLHYLETTYKNSRQGFEQLLRSTGGMVQ